MAFILWLIAVAMVLNGLKVAIGDRRVFAGLCWIVAGFLVGPAGVSIFNVH